MQGLLDDKFNERKNNITKGFSDDIEKGQSHSGEGSRGGLVIAHTHSGKPIYAGKLPEKYDDFNSEDHNDAARFHSNKAYEARKEFQKTGDEVHLDVAELDEKLAAKHSKKAQDKRIADDDHKVSLKEIGGTHGLFKHFVNNPDYMATHHADDDKISVRHVASGRLLHKDEIKGYVKGAKSTGKKK